LDSDTRDIRDVSTEELVAELILRVSRIQSELLRVERDNTGLRLEIARLKAQMLKDSARVDTRSGLN
jgi:hypothetical protein